jgi:hypothetical protein
MSIKDQRNTIRDDTRQQSKIGNAGRHKRRRFCGDSKLVQFFMGDTG